MYFSSSFLLEAGLGSNLSYVWHSIYVTQALLLQGLACRVGDGKDTNIWLMHLFLDGINPYVVINPSRHLINGTVLALMVLGEDGGMWTA